MKILHLFGLQDRFVYLRSNMWAPKLGPLGFLPVGLDVWPPDNYGCIRCSEWEFMCRAPLFRLFGTAESNTSSRMIFKRPK